MRTFASMCFFKVHNCTVSVLMENLIVHTYHAIAHFKKTHVCKCADLLCICPILEPSLGPTFYFHGHPGKRRGSWMADRMRQMHNRSAPFNDAMVKKSSVFDYRRSQVCTPPERLQGRIFIMCGPIVHLSGFKWKAASSRQPEFKIVCGCVGVSTKWRPL